MTSAFVVLFAALGWYASTGAGTAWPVAWFAPIPLLVIAFRSERDRLTLAMVFIAYALGGVDLIRLYGNFVPLSAILAVIAGSALAYTGVVALVRRARGRLSDGWLALLFPIAWTAFEVVQSRISPNGTAGSVAYSQVYALPIAQIAAYTGWPGLTFLVTWVPAAAAWAIVRRDPRILLPPILVLGAVVGFGLWRIDLPAPGAPLRVGLVAADNERGFFTDDPEALPRTLAAYQAQIAAVRARGAEFVVLPEEVVTATSADQLAAAQTAFAAAGVPLIVGVNDLSSGERQNVAWWLEGGQVAATYAKHHLVPGFEADVIPGADLVIRDGRGVAICKDLDFPALSRRYARGGARILFVPAWDFGADGPLHAKMAVLRGIESGFAVVRAARNGRLTASDDRGRVDVDLASADPGRALATVVPGSGPTFYARVGDVFGWLVVAACAALMFRVLRPTG